MNIGDTAWRTHRIRAFHLWRSRYHGGTRHAFYFLLLHTLSCISPGHVDNLYVFAFATFHEIPQKLLYATLERRSKERAERVLGGVKTQSKYRRQRVDGMSSGVDTQLKYQNQRLYGVSNSKSKQRAKNRMSKQRAPDGTGKRHNNKSPLDPTKSG